jgi:Arc/MetJ family transcription regulator
MKTTIDIPDEELEAVMRNTGAATKREAVVTAVSEFNRRKEMQKLIAQFGTFEKFMTQQELRRMREEP